MPTSSAAPMARRRASSSRPAPSPLPCDPRSTRQSSNEADRDREVPRRSGAHAARRMVPLDLTSHQRVVADDIAVRPRRDKRAARVASLPPTGVLAQPTVERRPTAFEPPDGVSLQVERLGRHAPSVRDRSVSRRSPGSNAPGFSRASRKRCASSSPSTTRRRDLMLAPRHHHAQCILRLGIRQLIDQLVQPLLCGHGTNPSRGGGAYDVVDATVPPSAQQIDTTFSTAAALPGPAGL